MFRYICDKKTKGFLNTPFFLFFSESETAFSIIPLTNRTSGGDKEGGGSGSDETGSTIRSARDISLENNKTRTDSSS